MVSVVVVTQRTCLVCGRGFDQPTGRPAKRCPSCSGGTSERYGTRHQKLRAATLAQAWYQPCSRCGRVMLPDQELHLDHVDGGPDEYLGWSHAACNLAASNRPNGRPARLSAPLHPGQSPPDNPKGTLPDVHGGHGPDCRCREVCARMGRWPSRCW